GLEAMDQKPALAVAAKPGDQGAALERGDEFVEADNRFAAPWSRQGQTRPHDGEPASHASRATSRGAGPSCAMNVFHQSARFSRYQRLAPSAVRITRSTSAWSSRSVSSQRRRNWPSAKAASGPS